MVEDHDKTLTDEMRRSILFAAIFSSSTVEWIDPAPAVFSHARVRPTLRPN